MQNQISKLKSTLKVVNMKSNWVGNWIRIWGAHFMFMGSW